MSQAILEQNTNMAGWGFGPTSLVAPIAGGALSAPRPHVDPQGATRGLADNDTAVSRDRRAPGALNPWGDYGPLAMAGGWRTIPIKAGEKGPRLTGWQDRGVPTNAEVAAWAATPAASMGLVLGAHRDLPEHEHVVAVDMDVTNPAAARAVLDIVRRYAPGAPLRTGNPAKPGAAFVRVSAGPGEDMTLRQGSKYRFADTPEGKTEQVEMLGAGRQAVIHGMHPAGVHYEWEGGRGIPEIQVADLPCLTVAQAVEMIAECDAAIERAGGALKQAGRVSSKQRSGGEAYLPELSRPAARELLTGLEQTANDLDREGWIPFVKAIWAMCRRALGDEAVFEALLLFTDAWKVAPGGADVEELRRVLSEETPLEGYGLRHVVWTMRRRGWAAGRGFSAKHDFVGVPYNDNDMPEATGRAPKAPRVAPADMSANSDALSAMNERHAVAKIGSGVAVVRFGEPGTVPSLMQKNPFFDMMAPQKITGSDGRRVPIAPVWFGWSKRRTFLGGVKMFPQGINGDGLPVPADTLNTWMGFVTTPAEVDGSDWPIIREYLRDILCAGDRTLYAWLLNWLAHAVQFPHEKPGTALILKGPQGSGKTTLTELLRAVFHSAHIVSADRPEALLGKFNAHLREALVVIADEAVFAGDPAANNRLKAFVTDSMITVEQKGLDSYTVPSHHRLVMTSNEDHVVRAETDARRWAVFDVSGDRVGDAAYFRALYAVLQPNHPEVRAFLRDLAAMTVDCDAVRRAPTTGGLIEQIAQSLPAPQQWLREMLRDSLPASKSLTPQSAADAVPYCPDFGSGDGEWPAYASREALTQSFDRWATGRRYLRGNNPNALGKLLKMFGSAMQVRCADGSRRRVIKLGTLTEARDAFAAAYLRGVSDASVWGEPDEAAVGGDGIGTGGTGEAPDDTAGSRS